MNFSDYLAQQKAYDEAKDKISVGQTVAFTVRGEDLVGIVTKKNPKRAQVTLENGKVWNCPYTKITPSDAKVTLPPPPDYGADKFRVGDRVRFGKEGSKLEGTVIRVNQKTLSIEVEGELGYYRCHPALAVTV